MNIKLLYTVSLLLFGYVNVVTSFELYTAFTLGAAALAGYLGRCRFMECCDDGWIIGHVDEEKQEFEGDFQQQLEGRDMVVVGDLNAHVGKERQRSGNGFKSSVFGQHLAVDIVSKAVRAHVRSTLPKKALTLSFHGWPGGGKNYVSQFIVTRLYKEGYKSKYVHLLSGRIHFPLADKADIYRMHLQDWIRGNVSNCERSLFIFDEVEKIPRGVLDGVKPFLDYHELIDGVDFRKSIFIFMGNTGGNVITKRYLELWEAGRSRKDMTLRDFEDLLRRGAFNEAGGLHKSETIESNLIDHYVPFLPLEENHVRQCIESEFRNYFSNIPQEYIDEIMKDVTFGPEENKMFSNTGCKRLSQKVAALTERLNW